MAMRKEPFPIDTDIQEKSALQQYIERFPCACSGCRDIAVMVDALGNHWCASCEHRGLLLSLAFRYSWPIIPTGRHTLVGGAAQWRTVIMMGDEAMIGMLLRAMKRIDERWHERAMQAVLMESESEA